MAKLTKEEKAENSRAYLKGANKNIVHVRMTPRESALLEIMMREDGWENRSAFIRYKLFGYKPEKMTEKIIVKSEPEPIGILLRHQLMDLASSYIYIRYRYDKDMNQLYREPGVDPSEWINATNKWHTAFIEKIDDTFVLLRRIAAQLGLKDFFASESDAASIDLDVATQDELNALAEQIRLEQIGLGLPDPFGQ